MDDVDHLVDLANRYLKATNVFEALAFVVAYPLMLTDAAVDMVADAVGQLPPERRPDWPVQTLRSARDTDPYQLTLQSIVLNPPIDSWHETLPQAVAAMPELLGGSGIAAVDGLRREFADRGIPVQIVDYLREVLDRCRQRGVPTAMEVFHEACVEAATLDAVTALSQAPATALAAIYSAWPVLAEDVAQEQLQIMARRFRAAGRVSEVAVCAQRVDFLQTARRVGPEAAAEELHRRFEFLLVRLSVAFYAAPLQAAAVLIAALGFDVPVVEDHPRSDLLRDPQRRAPVSERLPTPVPGDELWRVAAELELEGRRAAREAGRHVRADLARAHPGPRRPRRQCARPPARDRRGRRRRG